MSEPWGDASHLVDILDVRPAGERRFESVTRGSSERSVAEASQLLGQALVAAGRFAPGRRAVSANMVFFRPADAVTPLVFELDEYANGRSFTALGVRVGQAGKLRAAGTLLLDVTAPDVMRHSAPAPPCPGPDGCEAVDMGVTGREIRVAPGEYDNSADAPLGPPTIDAWVRFDSVPSDPCLHAALMAQFTGHMSIAAAMRPHAGIGQEQAHRTLSTGINAITVSLHADVRADEWLRYHHDSTFAGDGMTHSECRVYTGAGDLVASFTVEAMVRAMNAEGAARGERSAL